MLRFDELNKISCIIFKEKKLLGFLVSENNQLAYFKGKQED